MFTPTKSSAFGLTAIVTAALVAAVSFSGDAFAQRRQSLSERVAELERKLGQSGAVPAKAADGELVAELLDRLDLLQSEVQSLNERVERQGNEIESLKQRQRAQFLDLDERLNRLQGGGPRAVVVPPVANQPTDRPTTPEPTNTATMPSTELSSGDARAAYEDAFSLVKATQYTEAISAFNEYLARYGDSEYADNAQYWLGESYYASGNYSLALEAFQKLVEQYPDSTKIADARLKIGFTHYGLEQWEEAEQALNGVIESYQGSTAARLADNRLRVMRLQGRIR